MVQTLMAKFEGHALQTEENVEYWLARDLQELLGYSEWRSFSGVVLKAKTACELTGHQIDHHFGHITKMVRIGSGAEREVEDIMLTRYACYLIAQNGDSGKPQIAFAQTYFAYRTRQAELIEKRIQEAERIAARQKLKITERELNDVIYQQTGGEENFAIIRSKGDKALFDKTTREMKSYWNVPKGQPLADYAPTIILKAKDFATEITIHNTRVKQLTTEPQISQEHIDSNAEVRNALLNRGIRPETLQAAEDIKKVTRRVSSDEKKALKDPEALE